MLAVFVKQAHAGTFPNWADLKLFMVAQDLRHCFVTSGSLAWNVTLRGGRLSKHTA